MRKILVFSHASVLEVNRDVFYQLSRRFDVDLRIVCPRSWRGDLIRDLRCQENSGFPAVRLVPIPVAFSGNGSLFWYRTQLRRALEGWEPDFVFVDEEPWSVACFQAHRAFPDAELAFYTKQNLPKKVPPPFNLFQRSVFRRSPFCFSVSSEVSDVLRWKGFSGEIRYLPHSFDPGRFSPLSESARESLRRDLGLRGSSCVVSYFGRLDPEKGVTDLCQALIKLDGELAPAALEILVVGNGSLRNEIRAKLSTGLRRKAVLLDALPHDQVGLTLAAADILVLPSRTVRNWKEQFGRILVEAMACGLAVIGSDSGEIPHLIKRSGGGLVFREGSVPELASCIERLARDPELRKEFARQGRRFASEKLAHAQVADDLGGMLNLSPRPEAR